jgi:hypothetical protein
MYFFQSPAAFYSLTGSRVKYWHAEFYYHWFCVIVRQFS